MKTKSVINQEVFEALGEASMCWNPKPTGVFDSTKAQEIGNRLIASLAQQPEESGLVEELEIYCEHEKTFGGVDKIKAEHIEEILSRHKESKPIDNKGNDKGLVEQIEKLLHEPCLAIDAWRKVERIKTVIAKFKEK